jgi:RNA recognition motif-containing protein
MQQNNKLHVGGLPYDVDEKGLADLLGPFGTVKSAKVITDRDTGRSKGFGFVEMSTAAEAQSAITALNGSAFGGRTLSVSEAKPKESSGQGGRGGRGDSGRRSDRW